MTEAQQLIEEASRTLRLIYEKQLEVQRTEERKAADLLRKARDLSNQRLLGQRNVMPFKTALDQYGVIKKTTAYKLMRDYPTP